MRIGVPAEVRPGETRVAATPETVKKLAAKNEVRIQAGAGAGSNYPDGDYEAAGGRIVGSAAEAYDADIVLKVRSPSENELEYLKTNTTLIGLLEPFNAAGLEAIAKCGVNGFAMESLPRCPARNEGSTAANTARMHDRLLPTRCRHRPRKRHSLRPTQRHSPLRRQYPGLFCRR